MAKYLFIASYSTEGLRGVRARGGTARREAIERMAAGLGGRLESFYFAFGGDDAFVTVDLPDNKAAAAVALTVGSSGVGTTRTVVLLTPEDIDEAVAVDVAYTPPTA